MSLIGVNNSSHLYNNQGYIRLDKGDVIVPEINVNDYNYYKIEIGNIQRNEAINIFDYVEPIAKYRIDSGLRDFFGKNDKGNLLSDKLINSRNFIDKKNPLKKMSHKAVQTARLSVCTHYNRTKIRSIQSNIKREEIKSFNGVANNCLAGNNRRGNNNPLFPQIISAAKKITSSDEEETRKKLHITRISTNAPIFINKGSSNNIANNNKNSNNYNSNNELRYINIKCNTKFQQIPVTHPLHKSNAQVHQNSSSSSYLFNRGKNNYNFISKTKSISHVQELKTYSRKNDNGTQSKITADNKYLSHQASEKFQKI